VTSTCKIEKQSRYPTSEYASERQTDLHRYVRTVWKFMKIRKPHTAGRTI